MGGTLLDHFADGGRGIDFHGRQITKPIHLPRILPELLSKCIGKIIALHNKLLLPSYIKCRSTRVRADEQDRFTDLGELHGEGAGCGCLADTAFPAAEDPFQGFLGLNSGVLVWRRYLVEDVLQRRRQVFVHFSWFV